MGHTLSKIAYFEGDQLNLSLFPTKNSFEKISELINACGSRIEAINFTGGKAYSIFKKYESQYPCNLVNEFEAIVKGTEFLFQLRSNKSLPDCLIITIGTGTSIILKQKKFMRIGGTALGGGFFLGITELLYQLNNYQEIIELTEKGNRYNVDLKVSDIYDPQDDRIDKLFREFTASSLGKIDRDSELNSIKKEDVLNSILCLIGENIGIISSGYANNFNIQNLIYCGGFLLKNNLLRRILKLICRINNQKPIFLQNSEFTGVLGALIY